MVNDLKQLLHDNVTAPPPDHLDLAGVVSRGRSRVRVRRAAVVAGTVAAVAVLGAGGAALGGLFDGGPGPASHRGQDAPVGPVVKLSESVPAVAGRDYRVVTSWTNENLDRANGQYLDGITDDGRVVLRDGPHGIHNEVRLVLLDQAMKDQDSLPPPPQSIQSPVELGAERLVYSTARGGLTHPGVAILDRDTHTWRTMSWPGLPDRDYVQMQVGADDRLYVAFADPAVGSGLEKFDLWSASLTDRSDVRDEHLVVGEFDLLGDELTWTSTHNAPNDGLHVRDLGTGQETDVDPMSGDRCNQLSLSRTPSYVVMYQYCGTHDGVRDDRVQVVTPSGDPVVTIQGDGVELGYATDRGVVVDTYARKGGGSYLYEFESGRLRRMTDAVSHFGLVSLFPDGSDYVGWHTPETNGHGATQWIGEVR